MTLLVIAPPFEQRGGKRQKEAQLVPDVVGRQTSEFRFTEIGRGLFRTWSGPDGGGAQNKGSTP